MQNKNDQIAAAIVLRGLTKGGKFANANDAANGKVVAAVKSAVESGVQKTMSSLTSLVKQSIVGELGKVANVVQSTNSTATSSGGSAPKKTEDASGADTKAK